MLHYVESGTKQTLAYGDIDTAFYNSLCSMVDRILEVSSRLEDDDHRKCSDRLAALDARTRNRIGWGYSDHIEAAAAEMASRT